MRKFRRKLQITPSAVAMTGAQLQCACEHVSCNSPGHKSQLDSGHFKEGSRSTHMSIGQIHTYKVEICEHFALSHGDSSSPWETSKTTIGFFIPLASATVLSAPQSPCCEDHVRGSKWKKRRHNSQFSGFSRWARRMHQVNSKKSDFPNPVPRAHPRGYHPSQRRRGRRRFSLSSLIEKPLSSST